MNYNLGGLYHLPSTSRIEIYDNPNQQNSYIVDFVGLLEAKEIFVLLEVISFEDIWWRLKVLTTKGEIGWINVQFIQYLEEVECNEVVSFTQHS